MIQNRFNIKYELLLALAKESLHGRELAKRLNIPLTNVQRTLKDLADENVIEYRTSGKNKLYSIKNNLKAKKYLVNSENYKLIKLLNEKPFFDEIFGKLCRINIDLIILFGSYAKSKAKESSDIDIYLESDNAKVKKEAELINSKINAKTGSFNKNDLLIKEIIKNHIIIKGAERYYERLFE